jgi:integrase
MGLNSNKGTLLLDLESRFYPVFLTRSLYDIKTTVPKSIIGSTKTRRSSGLIVKLVSPHRQAPATHRVNKEREIPLNASARRALSAYLQLRPEAQPGESLFLSDRNGAFSPRAVQTLLQRLARRSKIARLHVTPHLLRHTFALKTTPPIGTMRVNSRKRSLRSTDSLSPPIW